MDSYKAIVKYWKDKLNLTVYEQGQVPDNAKLPYCTVTLADGSNGDSARLSVFTWHEKNKNIERIAYAEKLHNAIPISCETISVKNGILMFTREGNIEPYKDEGAIANRMSYGIRYYII